ncbi:hypothetical protein PSEUDO9AG_70134 [Pseudomonas sp. 9Ag]|nr:hypothetical protein PSEUDO9AG_70134 [Pseudomonas sp. 9Ag]
MVRTDDDPSRRQQTVQQRPRPCAWVGAAIFQLSQRLRFHTPRQGLSDRGAGHDGAAISPRRAASFTFGSRASSLLQQPEASLISRSQLALGTGKGGVRRSADQPLPAQKNGCAVVFGSEPRMTVRRRFARFVVICRNSAAIVLTKNLIARTPYTLPHGSSRVRSSCRIAAKSSGRTTTAAFSNTEAGDFSNESPSLARQARYSLRQPRTRPVD